MQPTIAVDLAKNVFEIAVSNHPGTITTRRRLSRKRFLPFLAQQSRATVLLEACSSAHFWARSLQQLGHSPVLLPPRLVRPYRQGNKTDRADAKALLEAHRSPDSPGSSSTSNETFRPLDELLKKAALLPTAATRHMRDGDPVGPGRGGADNNSGYKEPVQRMAPRPRFPYGQETTRSTNGPKIRLQS